MYYGNQNMLSPTDRYNLNLENLVSARYQNQLAGDLRSGRQRGAEVYGEGSLGRLSTDRPEEHSYLLSTYRDLSEKGLNAPQYQALNERRLGEIRGAEQTRLAQQNRNLANSGVRGGAAANIQSQTLRQSQIDRGRASQDMALADVAYRDKARADYANTFGQVRQDEAARQMYNNQQRNKELQGRQAYEFGYASLGAAQRGAAQKYVAGQQQVQQAQANAMADSGGGK